MDQSLADVDKIFRNRIGVKLNRFEKELSLEACVKRINFLDPTLLVVAPVSAPRGLVYDGDNLDLAIRVNRRDRRQGQGDNQSEEDELVGVELGYPPIDTFSEKKFNQYRKLFQHALYLDQPVLYFQCPRSEMGLLTLTSLINENMTDQCHSHCLLSIPLFSKQTVSRNSPVQDSDLAWFLWNAFKTYLGPFNDIGLCLELNDDLLGIDGDLLRWRSEKIHSIVIHSDRFVFSPAIGSERGEVRLSGRCKDFIRQIVIANSFRVALIVNGLPGEDMYQYVDYLRSLYESFSYQYPDQLRIVNDKLCIPMQPLAFNLSSSIYSVFEEDRVKYTSYETAMTRAIEAVLEETKLTRLMAHKQKGNTQLVFMVLGAGRGPLVDAFINAIKAVEGLISRKNLRVKIFALDKNPNSIVALKYKLVNEWSHEKLVKAKFRVAIDVEVVESDMREWKPNCKADIIATELLGSLADNELSPECIDGTWRFSTCETISIPQSYTSYIEPIGAARVWQEAYVRCMSGEDKSSMDRIYTCRLANFYPIDEYKALFGYEHFDISKPPVEGQNERYAMLDFHVREDTVCHGFAGYFRSKLFKNVAISTLPCDKTPTMESWFPMYIPLEQPVPLVRGNVLTLHFWRKESNSKVWYEWAVSSPKRSRIHSMQNNSSAMCKFI